VLQFLEDFAGCREVSILAMWSWCRHSVFTHIIRDINPPSATPARMIWWVNGVVWKDTLNIEHCRWEGVIFTMCWCQLMTVSI